ncbi:MAG TPA: glycosyltransferase family 4 protein [Planctomycetota bacterium]
MRIALVHPDLGRAGGAEAVVAWTAAGLLDRGHELAIFTHRFAAELWPDGRRLAACVRPLSRLDESAAPARLRSMGRGLRSQLAGFDLVHPHQREALHATEGCVAPRLWFCHEPWRRLHLEATDRELFAALDRPGIDAGHPALQQLRRWHRRQTRWPWRRFATTRAVAAERAAVARATATMVQSGYTARAFREAFGREPEVFDLGHPAASEPAPVAEVGVVRHGIGVTAGTSPKKNLHTVLATAQELVRRGSLGGQTFEIWGGGTDSEETREMVRAHGLGERVRLHGFLGADEAAALRRRCRLGLYLPLCEPFGLVAVEFLLSGTPVLVSDHGGPAETIARTNGGATVDPLRPDAIADRLEQLFADPASLVAMGQRGAQRARELFGMPRFLDALEARMHELAAAAQ